MRYTPDTTVEREAAAPQQTPSLTTPAAGKLKIGFAKKTEAAKSDTPIFPDPDGKAGEIAARIADRQDKYDALESALETDKAELARIIIRPWYFRHYHRRPDAPSSVLVRFGPPTSPLAVRVSIQDGYHAFPDTNAFIPILGDRTDRYFRTKFELKVDGDKLPGIKESAQKFLDDLQDLCAKHGCTEAVTYKDVTVPVAGFKALRLTELTLEESIALETVGDKGLTKTAVSTKNTKK